MSDPTETEAFGDTVESAARNYLKRTDVVAHDILLLVQAVRLAKSPMPESPTS